MESENTTASERREENSAVLVSFLDGRPIILVNIHTSQSVATDGRVQSTRILLRNDTKGNK